MQAFGTENRERRHVQLIDIIGGSTVVIKTSLAGLLAGTLRRACIIRSKGIVKLVQYVPILLSFVV